VLPVYRDEDQPAMDLPGVEAKQNHLLILILLLLCHGGVDKCNKEIHVPGLPAQSFYATSYLPVYV